MAANDAVLKRGTNLILTKLPEVIVTGEVLLSDGMYLDIHNIYIYIYRICVCVLNRFWIMCLNILEICSNMHVVHTLYVHAQPAEKAYSTCILSLSLDFIFFASTAVFLFLR